MADKWPSASKPTRRSFNRSISLGLPMLSLGLSRFSASSLAWAESPRGKNPGRAWEHFSKAEATGFNASALDAVEASLYAKPTTSLLVIKSGKIAYSYGDIAEVSYLASARKSVLSMLYGKYIADGKIDLTRTIGDLGINEGGDGLMPIEKTATIRDLLISSSGVYWPAGSPGSAEATPPRGSKKPGSYFFYNNWDFNVAGAVFEQLTGKTVFKALHEDLALPLQFEDFDPERQLWIGFRNNPSRYKAYHMFLSARDMARLGLVMIHSGIWNGKALIPSAWIKQSTSLQVPSTDTREPAGLGYGYLWWIPTEVRKGAEWENSFAALGNYGQYLLGLPAIDTVIVHRRAVTSEFAVARNLGISNASPAGGNVSVGEFLSMADKLIAALH